LLAFGATWCQPCKEDYPLLKKLHQNYKQSGFEIVGVNMDDQKQTWLAQVAKVLFTLDPCFTTKESRSIRMLGEVFNVVYLPHLYFGLVKMGVLKYHSVQLKDWGVKATGEIYN
jgi:thiol-disulfide isomerase/thioredoxin